MAQFDIQTLDAIEPPRFHCAKCLALFWEPATSLNLDYLEEVLADTSIDRICPRCSSGHTDHSHPLCPVCHVRYVPAVQNVDVQIEQFLLTRHPSPWKPRHINQAWSLRFLNHCLNLGSLAMQARRREVPPHKTLLRALEVAQAFVHCTSFGPFHPDIEQTLVKVAQHVPVRGIIANADSCTVEHLVHLNHQHTLLTLKPQRGPVYLGDVQYQQLFIIDGLIAFRGSANDMLFEIHDPLPRKGVLDVITESDAIFALHNRFFSPLWAQESKEQDVIVMA